MFHMRKPKLSCHRVTSWFCKATGRLRTLNQTKTVQHATEGCLLFIQANVCFGAEGWQPNGKQRPEAQAFAKLTLPQIQAQLLLHLAATTAVSRMTPGHNSPRFKNGSKSTTASCLLDVTQLFLHLAGHNSPRFKNGSKSTASCLDVLDVTQLFLHLATVSATFWITTAPHSRMAAKALPAAWMRCTFLSRSCTCLLSPPTFGLPQVTTAPDSRMAAEALPVAWMC